MGTTYISASYGRTRHARVHVVEVHFDVLQGLSGGLVTEELGDRLDGDLSVEEAATEGPPERVVGEMES